MPPDCPVVPATSSLAIPDTLSLEQLRQLKMLHQLPQALRHLSFSVSDDDFATSTGLTYPEVLTLTELGKARFSALVLEPENQLVVIRLYPVVFKPHPQERERIRSLWRPLQSFTTHENPELQIICSVPRPLVLDVEYVHRFDDKLAVLVYAKSLGEVPLHSDVYLRHPIRTLPAKYLQRFYSVAAEALARREHPKRYKPGDFVFRTGWETP